MKNFVKLSLIVFTGFIGLTVLTIIFIGPFSPDVMQQSKLACKHAVEALTGNQYSITGIKHGKVSVQYSGFAADKNIDCTTSLLKREIINLQVGDLYRLKDLDHRDIIFNAQLDYSHNH